MTEALSACEAIKANSSLNFKNLLNDDSSLTNPTIKSDSNDLDSGIELINTFHSYALIDTKTNNNNNNKRKIDADDELDDKANLNNDNTFDLSNQSSTSKINDEFDDELDDDYYDEEEEDELMKIKLKYSHQNEDQCEELIEEDCGF